MSLSRLINDGFQQKCIRKKIWKVIKHFLINYQLETYGYLFSCWHSKHLDLILVHSNQFCLEFSKKVSYQLHIRILYYATMYNIGWYVELLYVSCKRYTFFQSRPICRNQDPISKLYYLWQEGFIWYFYFEGLLFSSFIKDYAKNCIWLLLLCVGIHISHPLFSN